jgi:uncharacterized protein YjeT (DUF2065 family)
MRGYLYRALTTFLLAAFFIAVGIIGMLAPWWLNFRKAIMAVLEQGGVTLSLFGMVFALIGIGLLMLLSSRFQQKSYYIRSGPYSVSVDPNVLQNTLQAYCQERFPGYQVASQAHISNDKLSIAMQLPRIPKESHKHTLNQIEKELREVLVNVFGYRKRFDLIVNFED